MSSTDHSRGRAAQISPYRVLAAAAVLAAGIGGLASPASAEGMYASIALGGGMVSDADNTGTALNIESEFEMGFTGLAAVGYGFDNGFAVEGELSYRGNGVDQLTITNAGATGVTAGDVDGDVNAWGFMANAKYTFNRTGEVRPFVLAGLGMAKVSADNINVAGVSLTDDSDTVVAYQAGVGVSYQFSPTMSVDASYRLFQTTDPTLNDSAGSPFDTAYTSHSFLVGMTFGF